MSRKLQLKRGLKAALPALAPAELAMVTDEQILYYGTDGTPSGNVPVARKDHTHTPEQVGASPSNHTHTAAQVGASPSNHSHTASQVGAAPSTHVGDASHATSLEKQTWNGKADPDLGNVNQGTFNNKVTSGGFAKSGKNYKATLSTSWTANGSSGFYQSVSVSGITSADTPIIDVVQSGTINTDKLLLAGWALVSRIVTSTNSITAYCYGEKPTVALPIQILVTA